MISTVQDTMNAYRNDNKCIPAKKSVLQSQPLTAATLPSRNYAILDPFNKCH